MDTTTPSDPETMRSADWRYRQARHSAGQFELTIFVDPAMKGWLARMAGCLYNGRPSVRAATPKWLAALQVALDRAGLLEADGELDLDKLIVEVRRKEP